MTGFPIIIAGLISIRSVVITILLAHHIAPAQSHNRGLWSVLSTCTRSFGPYGECSTSPFGLEEVTYLAAEPKAAIGGGASRREGEATDGLRGSEPGGKGRRSQRH